MRTIHSPKTCSLIIMLFTIALLLPAVTGADKAQKNAPGVNLAAVAKPSSSHVSGDTTLTALNNGFDPRNSQDRSKRSYGNWPHRGTQWVAYEWAQPISTKRIDVYWWNDRRGVRNPKACRLLYWREKDKAFAPVPNAAGLGVLESQYNTTTFDEVRTRRLRLEIDSTERYSTGILEWKVYDSGNSPDFPPRVDAGVDRVCVQGGKTYLKGSFKTLGKPGATKPKITWRCMLGPRTVVFENANALETTATFPDTGVHRLLLRVEQGDLSSSESLDVKVVPRPPAKHLELIDTAHYTIDSPFWFNRAKAIITRWIPHCIKKIEDPNLREGGLNNFLDAANKLAGKPHGNHRGYVFSNAWVYNTMESICVALMVDPRGDAGIRKAQAAMRKTLDDWIPKVLAAQEPDGYIQTVYTLSDRTRWTPRFRADHEGYVAGYFLEAGIAHYMLTNRKDDRLYKAAKKLADCWDDHIGPPPKQKWFDGHQAMEIGLVRFGRFVNQVEGKGKGDKYIALSKFLLDCREGGHSYDQSHVPVIEQYEAVGHAVRASYSYAGMSDVAMETHDIDYQSAVASLWDNIVNRKYYVTGGIGSGETSEGFGPDYSLRHHAYCESCSSCGEIFFQHKLNLATHEAKYADLYEETLYNALLGSLDLAGDNFYYQNPLVTSRMRYPWHGCPCCVGNIPRTLLMLPTWMYAKNDDTIYVNLFVASKVTIEDVAGTNVQLIQKTEYPWKGDVTITINPEKPKNFNIKIRYPNRSISELYACTPDINPDFRQTPLDGSGFHELKINGQPKDTDTFLISIPGHDGYATLNRKWKAGDTITFTLPMPVQRIKGIDKIEATRGQVALRRGPLIYCVEDVDQPMDKVLSPEGPLKTEWDQDLLDGVMLIKGTWADGTPLTAIPYYSRANRMHEATEEKGRRAPRSTVWIKDK